MPIRFHDLNLAKLLLTLTLFGLHLHNGRSQTAPRTYVAHKTSEAIVIDGKADEKAWDKAKWSDKYIDIEGDKKPKYDTRMKMLWNEQELLIFVEMSAPHIWADLKQRDTIIFYNNDFEIFIDPDGDTHNYYELEMNALNTVWDLFLSKPYRNHGAVLGDWDLKGLKTAVHVQGTLNDASDIDTGWSAEISIPWAITASPGGTATVPENHYWRMNFSRVNWDFDLVDGRYYRKKDPATQMFLPEYNWVWSPQGVINMHEPEHWGYVYFSTEEEPKVNFVIPDDEAVKWYLYELFRDYSAEADASKITQKTINGKTVRPQVSKHRFGWTIWTKSPFTQNILSIKDDGKFEVSDPQ